METNEPAPHGGRACLHCGEAIPTERRHDAKYCSPKCARAKAHQRLRENNPDALRVYAQTYARKNPEKLAARQREFREKNPEAHRIYNEKYAAKRREALKEGTAIGLLSYKRTMLNAARARARKAGVPFNLTVEDLHIPDRCPILGLELRFGVGMPTNNSPSLDKVVPSAGYVRGNCVIISNRANMLKSNATVVELQALASFYTNLISSGEWMVPPAR